MVEEAKFKIGISKQEEFGNINIHLGNRTVSIAYFKCSKYKRKLKFYWYKHDQHEMSYSWFIGYTDCKFKDEYITD